MRASTNPSGANRVERRMNYAPIDADGHVMETDDELRRYLPPPFEGRRALTALFPSLDGWPRSTRKSPDHTPCLQKWRQFLDQSGVAGAVLYPTMGLAMALIKDAKWAGNGALLQQLSLRRISRKGAAPAMGRSLAAASGRRRSRRRVGTLCQGIENDRRSDSGGWVAARSRPYDVRSAL